MEPQLPLLLNRARRIRRVNHLSYRPHITLAPRPDTPRLFAAWWSVNDGMRSCLVIGSLGFAAGTILPLLLLGSLALCLVLSYAGIQAAAATAQPARSRPRIVRPVPLPTIQSTLPAPTPPLTLMTPSTLSHPFSIEIIERDLPSAEPVEPGLVPTNEPATRPLIGWPSEGPITQGFGCSPYYTGIPGPGCLAEAPWFHDGVDIAAGAGTPVQASLTGTVIFAGPDSSGPLCQGRYRGYGLAVVIDNGSGWQALYAHLSRVEVAAGEIVTPARVIGRVGDTGCVSGSHLHFGLRHDGQLVNPEVLR